ncbi:unnamed protein product [Urochloa decumbens]|uniref:Serine protease n=1 Tax=Urochloa decumbens TaxID=240449 RepID=A0ABC8YRR5_9POAL
MNIQKSAQETFNNLHKSVVWVLRNSPNDPKVSSGSGFIIGKTQRGSYLVMTCEHVIRGPDPEVEPIISVRIPNDDKDTTEYEAVIVKGTKKDAAAAGVIAFSSKRIDLAIIEVCGVTRECQPLEFCDPKAVEDVRPETNVFILGYVSPPTRPGTPSYLNLEPAVLPGIVSTPVKNRGAVIQDIAFTSHAKHGVSGSPLIFGGRVLGANCQQGIGSNTCYARSVNTVNSVLKQWLQIADNKMHTTKELIGMLQSRG